MSETIILSLITGASGLLGVLIGGWLSAIANERRSKSEERRQFRELGVKVALANFEVARETAQKVADRCRDTVFIPPMKAFLVQGIKLMEALADPRMSTAEMLQRIQEGEDLAQGVASAAKDNEAEPRTPASR